MLLLHSLENFFGISCYNPFLLTLLQHGLYEEVRNYASARNLKEQGLLQKVRMLSHKASLGHHESCGGCEEFFHHI
jgi:hypothetical protein